MNAENSVNSLTIDPTKIEKWKAFGVPTAVRLTDSHGKVTHGEVYVQTWDQPARMKRAMKTLFMLWGLGAFSLVFPIIHFVLPPLLLITGPVMAFLLAQQASVVLGGVGPCPNCGASLEIMRANYFKPEDRWPLTDHCSKCGEEAKVERA